MVDELGTSEVPLIKSVVSPSEREFFPTEAEYNGRINKQIIASKSGGGAIFTVPLGFVLNIVSAYIQAEDNSGSLGSTTAIEVINPDDSTEFILLHCGTTASGTQSLFLPITFPMPIKVEEGQRVTSLGSFPDVYNVGITGWLEPKRVVPG